MAEYLPSDSSLMAELSGGLHLRDWTLQTQLAAHTINVLRAADVNNIRVSGGKASAPTPIDVPSAAQKRKPRIDLSNHPLAQMIPKG